MVRDGFTPSPHGGLTSWARQGVLLLNTALTVRDAEANSHAKEWREFTDAVITKLNDRRRPSSSSSGARRLRASGALIDEERHSVLTALHPAARGLFLTQFREAETFAEVNRRLKTLHVGAVEGAWSELSSHDPSDADNNRHLGSLGAAVVDRQWPVRDETGRSGEALKPGARRTAVRSRRSDAPSERPTGGMRVHLFSGRLPRMDFNDLASKARPALITASMRRSTMTYGELARAIDLDVPVPHHINRVLDLVSQVCIGRMEPSLAVLVVNERSGEPGSGFRARTLGTPKPVAALIAGARLTDLPLSLPMRHQGMHRWVCH